MAAVLVVALLVGIVAVLLGTAVLVALAVLPVLVLGSALVLAALVAGIVVGVAAASRYFAHPN